MCIWSAGKGASQVEKIAATTITASTVAASTTVGGGPRHRAGTMSSISVEGLALSDAGIEPAVEQIGSEVGEAIDRGDQEDYRLHQRQVVARDRIDQQSADAGIGEYRLHG